MPLLVYLIIVRDLCLTSPGLVFPTLGLVFSTPGLVFSSRRVVGTSRRLGGGGWKYKEWAGWRVGKYAGKPLSIRNLFPKKCSPVHRLLISCWFPWLSRVKGWLFPPCLRVHQGFTLRLMCSPHFCKNKCEFTVSKMLNAWFLFLHRPFPFRRLNAVKHGEGFAYAMFHADKIENHTFPCWCEWVNHFFGVITRILYGIWQERNQPWGIYILGIVCLNQCKLCRRLCLFVLHPPCTVFR